MAYKMALFAVWTFSGEPLDVIRIMEPIIITITAAMPMNVYTTLRTLLVRFISSLSSFELWFPHKIGSLTPAATQTSLA